MLAIVTGEPRCFECRCPTSTDVIASRDAIDAAMSLSTPTEFADRLIGAVLTSDVGFVNALIAEYQSRDWSQPQESEPTSGAPPFTPSQSSVASNTFMTTSEVAEWLRLPSETVRYWRHVGKGPKSFKLPGSRRVLYAREDVEAFLAGNPVSV